MIEAHDFPRRDEFVNRANDLDRLEEWWRGPSRDAVCLYGRRRVGKSWLFRAFAHGKPALVLVADERALAPQLRRFADTLEAALGVRPELNDLPALLRAAYRAGRKQKLLVIIDEFPHLLPGGAAGGRVLSAVQAVMEEERENSKTKLLLCGSLIGQMESLLDQSSPLHGRLRPLDVRPLTFGEAQSLLEADEPAEARITRYAVTGGMARHLAELGRGGDLRTLVCRHALDRRGPLFRDPRDVLERELRNPATYFSILEELALGEAGLRHLATALGGSDASLTSYLSTLRKMRLITEHAPAGAHALSRQRRYRLDDGFVRFWFRFVFPHQDDLESGLAPEDLWDGEIAEFLPQHVAQTFESLCRLYVRRVYGREAPTVGGWWGSALNERPERRQEEIDVVGLQRKRLQVVGECKWTRSVMPASVLEDLRAYKIPAVAHKHSLKTGASGPRIVLFARGGFSKALHEIAAADPQVELIDAGDLVRVLTKNVT